MAYTRLQRAELYTFKAQSIWILILNIPTPLGFNQYTKT